MKKFKKQLIEGIKSALDIYEPYRPVLTESELKDVAILESVHDILLSGNIPDRSDIQENEIQICEEELA